MEQEGHDVSRRMSQGNSFVYTVDKHINETK